jgi:ligand-binding SRPBCC domain-containing protein
MARRYVRIVAGGGLAAALLAVSYQVLWRYRCQNWGATPDEVALSLPGDELMPGADVVTTKVIAIDAPPEAIWPWLVQMGSGRAGTYTYDWLENLFGLDMHSADVILPQFLDLNVGDEFPIGAGTLRVEAMAQDRLLTTRVPQWNWVRTFCLVPQENGTRLVLRNRIAYPGVNAVSQFGRRLVSEPGGLLMERKMLLGIKERAERLAGR